MQISSFADDQLLHRVAQGDHLAFEELYQRHHVSLFNYLNRLVNQPQTAEELLQDVFVSVWQSAGRFQKRAQVKTWMFRIAHNQAMSWFRKNKKDFLDLDDSLQPIAEGNPEAGAIQRWRKKQVHQALQNLSPRHRAVVELAFMHEFSYAQIAKIMECPVGTVKSRMNYALKHLGSILTIRGVDE